MFPASDDAFFAIRIAPPAVMFPPAPVVFVNPPNSAPATVAEESDPISLTRTMPDQYTVPLVGARIGFRDSSRPNVESCRTLRCCRSKPATRRR